VSRAAAPPCTPASSLASSSGPTTNTNGSAARWRTRGSRPCRRRPRRRWARAGQSRAPARSHWPVGPADHGARSAVRHGPLDWVYTVAGPDIFFKKNEINEMNFQKLFKCL
jgi:hypothetical protein